MLKNNEFNLALQCSNCVTKPCQIGCPLNNDITDFIKLINAQKYKDAYKTLTKTTVLPSVCGRICPHQKQCQGTCARKNAYGSIEIGKLESIIGDMAIINNWQLPKLKEKNKKKVAIIGAGPAGLTCAGFLQENGYEVEIYEKHSYLGGLLYHGIPEFRLDKNILKDTINKILNLGIKVHKNCELGKNLKLEELEKQYDAIFLGFGANISRKMNIPGENLDGVYGGNELLENKLHPNYINKKIAVVGGGNVAMDTARTIKRMGPCDVTVIYRRSEEEMPAEIKEIAEAKNEGIKFLFQTNPIKILGSNKVSKLECIKTELKKKENETRLSPVEIKGSNFTLDMDYVVMAVGSMVENEIINKLNLQLSDRGYIKVSKDYQTSNKKIFAGGDLIGAKGTVAWASRSGRDAAYSIMNTI